MFCCARLVNKNMYGKITNIIYTKIVTTKIPAQEKLQNRQQTIEGMMCFLIIYLFFEQFTTLCSKVGCMLHQDGSG